MATAVAPIRAQTAPEPEVQDALGADIHFVTPEPGEMQMLAASGVRWVRMDFDWAATERAKGQYDFSSYDGLVAALDAYHLQALFILDYSNPLYDRGLSPASDEAQDAFARWAAAAAGHFRGRGYLWEIYNEPNWHFWTPHPNRDAYIKLALATSEAIEEAAPGEKVIGPATAVIDPPFLEACFRAGLLNYWSAVSIHPYRPSDPETVAEDLRQVRLLIRQYAPPGKSIPIVASEFGYSSVWSGLDETKQARMLARVWLAGLANDVALTVWYDWRDDGADLKNPEDHFGLVGFRQAAAGTKSTSQTGPYRPKPAYFAAQTLTRLLGGLHFNKRLALESPDDYVLLFTKGNEVRLAAWTASPPHAVVIPASRGVFDVTGCTGEGVAPLKADRRGLRITLTGEPQYLAPRQPNELLAVAAAWQKLPLEIVVRAPGVLPLHLALRNPLQKQVRLAVEATGEPSEAGPAAKARPGAEASLELRVGAATRSVDPTALRVELEARGLGRVSQATTIVASNPLRLTVLPISDGQLPITVANPSGDAFHGFLAPTGWSGLKFPPLLKPIDLAAGTKEATLDLPLEESPVGAYEVGLTLVDGEGDRVLFVPRRRFLRVDDFSRLLPASAPSGYEVVQDGGAEGSAVAASFPDKPPPPGAKRSVGVAAGPPTPGLGALRIDFRLPLGEAALRLVPRRPDLVQISGQPEALGLWLWGDGSGVRPFVRFTDATGQTFQEGGPLDWQGWRYVLVYLNKPLGNHSGGANDGVIHYPIHWDSLLVLEGAGGRETKGTLYVGGPTLTYAIPEKGR